MSEPTKTDLDNEMSPTVSYELHVVVPHMSIDLQHRRVVREIFEQAAQLLRAAAIDQPRHESRLLLAHALGTTTDTLLRDPRAPVPPDAAARFGVALKARLDHVPVAHILGNQGFWTLDLAVSPATLIRADPM